MQQHGLLEYRYILHSVYTEVVLQETKKNRKIRDESSLWLQASFLVLIFLSALWGTVCRMRLPETVSITVTACAVTLTFHVPSDLEKTQRKY